MKKFTIRTKDIPPKWVPKDFWNKDTKDLDVQALAEEYEKLRIKDFVAAHLRNDIALDRNKKLDDLGTSLERKINEINNRVHRFHWEQMGLLFLHFVLLGYLIIAVN